MPRRAMMAASPTPEVVVRRMSAVAVLAALLAVLVPAGAVLAEPPFRLAERVTDQAGVLAPGQATQIGAAIDRLRTEDGVDLFVVYVDSFDGADGQGWADRTAELSQLGTEDVLLAVAVTDRAYGLSVAEGFPLSESTVDEIRTEDVEPRLAANDWAGAAIALADGLRTGGSDGGLPLAALVIGGVAVIGGGAYLMTRRRARASAPPPGEAPARDEFADVPTEELSYRASTALLEVDDAVRTSEQELAAARMHFGDEAVAGFATALEQARTDMLRAFELRQRLDDEQPETEQEQRALHAEIIRIAKAADDRLDAQVEAFDALRALEAQAPEYIANLSARRDAVVARVPQVEAVWTALQGRYAAGALEPVADDLDQARKLLAAADAEIAEARAALAGSGAGPAGGAARTDAGPGGATGSTGSDTPTGPAAAVVAGRAAEDALTQAERLLDGIVRRESELAEAAARIPAARAEVEQDIAEARATGSLAPAVARAEAAVAAATLAAEQPLPDPIAALHLLDEAGAALDHALAEARAAQDRARRAAATLDQALLTARAAVAAAADFITTRRGAVGTAARTRLAEAQRHLQQAGGPDPVTALREAQQADALAQEALRLAQTDVRQWSAPTSGTSLGVDLGSLVLGGILSGAARGYRSGPRGGGFGGGRRSPGSFGGSASRGRRGGGGRF